MNALLGYTGLVGSHLRERLHPDTTMYFNSKNFKEVTKHKFGNVFCACVPAMKWLANQNPCDDLSTVHDIFDTLVEIEFCRNFYLISTIDVHEHEKMCQVEDCAYPSTEPYGSHRLGLEKQLRERLGSRLVVVRLPALFGLGLKKNVLFDLLEDNGLPALNINTAFQWYSLSWLWDDICYISTNLPRAGTVNLYSPKIETRVVAENFFPAAVDRMTVGERLEYNHSSKHGMVERRSVPEILQEMGRFIDMYRYTKRKNHMVVSNMAWDPCHDDHAIFLMKRFGVRKVEVLPTKYAEWETLFAHGGDFAKKFEENGIEVYSLQSLLHGVNGDFLNSPLSVRKHLRRVMTLARDKGCRVVVLGAPRARVKGIPEDYLLEILDDVQQGFEDVRLCLEPNARAYGCHIGTDLSSVLRIVGPSNFFMNLDTGNARMSGDSPPRVVSDKILHVQISTPFLGPMLASSYRDLDSAGMTDYINRVVTANPEVAVSLEVDLTASRIQSLGEQLRMFCAYSSASFK